VGCCRAGVAVDRDALFPRDVDIAQVMALGERCSKELFWIPFGLIAVKSGCRGALQRWLVLGHQHMGPGFHSGGTLWGGRAQGDLKRMGNCHGVPLPVSSRPVSVAGSRLGAL